MNNNTDWRLGPDENRFLDKFEWQKKPWTQTRPHWDHDHCSFCGVEISASDEQGVLHEGYTTEDEYHWVCETCFVDFTPEMNWKMKKEA